MKSVTVGPEAPATDRSAFWSKWWTYQRERFPLAGHAPLIAAFSLSAVSYSFLLQPDPERSRPSWDAVVVAFITCVIFFLQLRIADEFKDADEDRRFRPYRPVPRGLVTLAELRMVFLVGAALQFVLATWLHVRLVALLFLVWTYLSLMGREFFVGTWIRTRPITYMWTHMMIMPLIDLFATACDWMVRGFGPPRGLFWFLGVSYLNGFVIEIGRKLRAPADEEPGVSTYTVLWGIPGAVAAWWSVLLGTAILALVAAREIRFLGPMAKMLSVSGVAAVLVGVRFLRNRDSRRAKWFEPISGVWTLILYLGLGLIPLCVRD